MLGTPQLTALFPRPLPLIGKAPRSDLLLLPPRRVPPSLLSPFCSPCPPLQTPPSLLFPTLSLSTPPRLSPAFSLRPVPPFSPFSLCPTALSALPSRGSRAVARACKRVNLAAGIRALERVTAATVAQHAEMGTEQTLIETVREIEIRAKHERKRAASRTPSGLTDWRGCVLGLHTHTNTNSRTLFKAGS